MCSNLRFPYSPLYRSSRGSLCKSFRLNHGPHRVRLAHSQHRAQQQKSVHAGNSFASCSVEPSFARSTSGQEPAATVLQCRRQEQCWSCRSCSIASSLPSISGGTLGVRRPPTLSHIGTDAGALAQRRSGHVCPEQELWGRNCARKAAPKKRRQARRRNGVRPVKQACNGTIEESVSSTDGLQRITTQLNHTHHVQHLLPPQHHHYTFQQPFTNVTPFLGLFSTVFVSKQIKQASVMSSFVLRPRLPC